MAEESTSILATHMDLWSTVTPICERLGWPVDRVTFVQVDTRPTNTGDKRKMLRTLDRPGVFVLSQSAQVKQWLIGAGWWHRGIADPGIDIYWRPTALEG